jgi:hypothetical protein
MRSNFISTAVTLSGALTIGLLAAGIHTPAAQAITYQRLLSTGQNVPGSNPVVDRFGPIAIDQTQNIAAVIGTAPEPGAFGSGTGRQTFQGVYQFKPTTRSPQLIEGGLSARFTNGEQRTDFPNISINNGTIAYFVNFSKFAPPQEIQPARTELKVANGSSIISLLTGSTAIGLTAPFENTIQTNTIAQGDTPFFVGEQKDQRDFSIRRSGVLTVTKPNQVVPTINDDDPIFSANPFDPLSADNIIRANNGNLLLVTQNAQGYRVIEKLATGALREVERGGRSCGAAIANTAIVFCGLEGTQNNPYRLMIRLPGTRAFQQIPVPSGIAISQPSIQNRTVIFRGIQENKVDGIYSSFNGQTAQRLIATGNKLDGKVISRLRLSDQGQSLNGKAIVFVATFADGSSALYRAIL